MQSCSVIFAKKQKRVSARSAMTQNKMALRTHSIFHPKNVQNSQGYPSILPPFQRHIHISIFSYVYIIYLQRLQLTGIAGTGLNESFLRHKICSIGGGGEKGEEKHSRFLAGRMFSDCVYNCGKMFSVCVYKFFKSKSSRNCVPLNQTKY